MKRIIPIVIAAVVVALQAPSTFAATPQQIFSATSSGMLLVSSACNSGDYGGSGFLVGPRVMITALHVLTDSDGTSCVANVEQDGTGATAHVSKWSRWYTVSKDDASVTDFAVAVLDRPFRGYSFRLAARSPVAGQRILALGYSLLNALSLNQGTLRGNISRSGVPMLRLNLLGGHGGSGGPIVDLGGFVVGLTQRGATDGTTSLVESLDLARFIGGRPASLCAGVAKGLTSTLCGGVKATRPAGDGGNGTPPTPPTPPVRPVALDVIEGWFATESSVDPAKKIFEAGAQQGLLYLIVRLNRLTGTPDPASIAVRILKPDGTVYSENTYPPQSSTPFQWWSLSLNLAGSGSLAPMGGTWTSEVSIDGSQTKTYAFNVVRLPNPFELSLTPAATFNPEYTYSIYLSWSQKQEVPSNDTFTAELISPSGAIKSTQTLSYLNLLRSGTEFLSPGYCYSSTYTKTTSCEYGTWTVNVRRSGTLIWSAGLQAGP